MKYFTLFAVLITSIIFVSSFGSSFASEASPQLAEEIGQPELRTTPELIAENKMTGIRHMPYKGICAPGFASLGEICVLDDRCGPGIYAGKVCVIDGVMKKYLKPLQQKHAGISVDNIICAEGKHVLFKSTDATPACVKLDSVEKLTKRGWQSEKPPIACTADYTPVCGVDGITYGNMCNLHAQHMAMNNAGECKAEEKPTPCTLDWTPVCGVDGITYGNMCMLDASGIEMDYQGECTE